MIARSLSGPRKKRTYPPFGFPCQEALGHRLLNLVACHLSPVVTQEEDLLIQPSRQPVYMQIRQVLR